MSSSVLHLTEIFNLDQLWRSANQPVKLGNEPWYIRNPSERPLAIDMWHQIPKSNWIVHNENLLLRFRNFLLVNESIVQTGLHCVFLSAYLYRLAESVAKQRQWVAHVVELVRVDVLTTVGADSECCPLGGDGEEIKVHQARRDTSLPNTNITVVTVTKHSNKNNSPHSNRP